MANDLINNAYLMEPLKKIKWRGSKSFQVSDHTEELGGGTPEESMEAAHPFPSPGPLHLLHLAVPELCPLQQTSVVKRSVFLSSMDHTLAIYGTQRRDRGNPRFIGDWWEAQVTTWDSPLTPEVEGSVV